MVMYLIKRGYTIYGITSIEYVTEYDADTKEDIEYIEIQPVFPTITALYYQKVRIRRDNLQFSLRDRNGYKVDTTSIVNGNRILGSALFRNILERIFMGIYITMFTNE